MQSNGYIFFTIAGIVTSVIFVIFIWQNQCDVNVKDDMLSPDYDTLRIFNNKELCGKTIYSSPDIDNSAWCNVLLKDNETNSTGWRIVVNNAGQCKILNNTCRPDCKHPFNESWGCNSIMNCENRNGDYWVNWK